ncbi:MAG TPA: hypothetical protein VG733_13720 [Chthoniobacteraceae bacterium]|nr:hypothetical protein [Chthoniobacteraceae bacterium]
MTFDEIKSSIASLSPSQQAELSAFLFQLRHASDREYQDCISARLSDADRSHWLTPEEFERKIEQQ